MKRVRNIWLPNADRHFEHMMAKSPLVMHGGCITGTYQLDKLQAALAITKKRRTAVDIGAHVGYWSMWLADEFREVVAFEPLAEHAECFERNVRQENVRLHRCAIGARRGWVDMEVDTVNSGRSHVSGAGDTPMITLDHANVGKVDLVKIDVEGMECDVISGGAATIQACHPIIVLEQNEEPDGVEMLMGMGMRVHKRIGHDWIMRW